MQIRIAVYRNTVPLLKERAGPKPVSKLVSTRNFQLEYYEGWNFNSGNYLFTTDTK